MPKIGSGPAFEDKIGGLKTSNMDERVTWLLPVRNGMPFLPETLASIETQTYQNWEVLAWDNGSTDETLKVLNEWIPARLPGRIISGKPLGLGASLTEMVKLTETELCARIDADDVNFPERLELEVAYLQAHPEIAVVGSQTNRLDKKGINHGLFMALPLCHNDIVHMMMYTNGVSHPTVLFRRSMILESGNYRDVGAINIEDYDLWLRIAARHPLANLDVPLVNYRVHDKSTTQIAMQENKLGAAMDLRFCEHSPELFGCSEEDARLLRERRHPHASAVLQRIALHLEGGDHTKAYQRLRSASFLQAGRALTNAEDFYSRLTLAALSGSRTAIAREAASVGKFAAKKMLGKMLRQRLTS